MLTDLKIQQGQRIRVKLKKVKKKLNKPNIYNTVNINSYYSNDKKDLDNLSYNFIQRKFFALDFLQTLTFGAVNNLLNYNLLRGVSLQE